MWGFRNWLKRTLLRCAYIFFSAFVAAMIPFFGMGHPAPLLPSLLGALLCCTDCLAVGIVNHFRNTCRGFLQATSLLLWGHWELPQLTFCCPSACKCMLAQGKQLYRRVCLHADQVSVFTTQICLLHKAQACYAMACSQHGTPCPLHLCHGGQLCSCNSCYDSRPQVNLSSAGLVQVAGAAAAIRGIILDSKVSSALAEHISGGR